ncbi:MAG: hypothetical protein ACREH9_09005, partial [Pseudomonadota bacterium]
EWRVALEYIASPAAFTQSRLLQCSSVWELVTPYLKNRFDKTRPKAFDQTIESYRDQIAIEWSKRFPDIAPPRIDPVLGCE